ncbi:MAG: SH3 domain-containing protein [Propionibacteriales bacterium]|nr:SH3 domain-containing protein [Propionibacteriales bacterium]
MIRFSPTSLARVVVGAATVAALGAGALAATDASAAAGYSGKVTGQQGVNARQAPSTKAAFKGTIAKGKKVSIWCKAVGTKVDGNSQWYLLSDHRWVSARYVANVGAAPKACPATDTDTAFAQVTSTVNKRSGPSTGDARTGSLSKGTKVEFRCQVTGPSVDGNNRWYLTNDGKSWVSARYLKNLKPGPGTLRYPVAC